MQLTVKLIPAKRRTMKETIFCYLVLFLSGVVSDNYKPVGCMNEIPGRILREKAANLKPNSPWHCQVFCTGYRYFGVEYGIKCFCGNTLRQPVTTSSACTMSCQGNDLLTCGGYNAIDIYQREEKKNG
ncbi:uncharacterized protein LOC144621092 [Crassostrea virginica]